VPVQEILERTRRNYSPSSSDLSHNLISLEYTSPESLPSPQTGLLQQIDSKADMWSLGMILHKILFFRLPYHYASGEDSNSGDVNEDGEKMAELEREIQSYSGSESFPFII
jgi:serine/threonine protein kinase